MSDAYVGFGTVANDLFGKGVPYYDNAIPQRVYDPEKAKSLLKQAGHPDGLNLTLYTSTAANGMLESATIYAQQAKAGGVNIKLFETPASTYYGPPYYLKVVFAQTNYQGVIPVMWSDSLTSKAPYNETDWKRPAFDKEFARAEATLDPVRRQQIFDDLQVELWNEGGYIIWGNNDTVDATSADVEGMVPSKYYPLGGCDFKSLWFS